MKMPRVDTFDEEATQEHPKDPGVTKVTTDKWERLIECHLLLYNTVAS
jgi:hypothetical protein